MYEYKGLVLEVIDYDTIIVEVDLGFDCRRIMYLRLQEIDFCLNDLRDMYPYKERIKEFITNLIKDQTIYFISRKGKKVLDYNVDIVYTTPDGEMRFLTEEIKNKFCKKRT